MTYSNHLLLIVLGLSAVCLALPLRLSAQQPDALEEAGKLIKEHEATVRPLEKAAALSAWNAQISGKSEDYKAKEAAENRVNAALSDTARFARLKNSRQALRASTAQTDGLVARQIELLCLQYMEKQIDKALLEAMTAKANAAERAFNVYRAKVDGKELTQSEVVKALKTSKDAAYRKQVWEASKGVGAIVEQDLKELVKLRNQAAQKLGFANYHEMQLQLSELNKEQVLKVFDELYELTRQPFAAAKGDIDAKLAKNYGIAPADLRPWHYQDLFFQEAPALYDADLDSAYEKADILKLSREYYAGIGLPVDGILARSDLFEKPGKYPHAQCGDMDAEGDVRVMANIVPNETWMGTMLHELGHGVYGTPNIPLTLPYVLRWPAHIFTTEGIAMMFEQFSMRGDWVEAMGIALPNRKAFDQAGSTMRRNRLLIFAAWSQVMVRFEMSMYANPDQDLNKLWWDLVEKYQLVHRPDGRNAPDYAAKIHIVSAPAYYHNYTMGQLFASQLYHTIARDVLKTDAKTALFNGHKEVGQFLLTKVFIPGRTMRWDAMVKYATGEELNAKAFAEDIR